MSEAALKLAQKIAHEVWQKYDDEHSYRTEKQERNAATPTDHPDNIWFFWNQFDHTNHLEFVAKTAGYLGTPAGDELWEWTKEPYSREMMSVENLKEMGIDI